jgi:ankyrin repeat protein
MLIKIDNRKICKINKEMTYMNNQYLKLEKSIEEIAEIKIWTDYKNKLIEELDIMEEEPNIIIGYSNRANYYNIYTKVKILITDEKAIKKNEYIIPEHIEYIVIYGSIYKNNKTEIEKIRNTFDLIKEINEKNTKKSLEILGKKEININQVDKYGYTALLWACSNKIEEIGLIILEKEGLNINYEDKDGYTALLWVCMNKAENMAIRIIERPEIEINHVDNNKISALIWACFNNMEKTALKILEKEKINIYSKDKNGKTALEYATQNNMYKVINKMNNKKLNFKDNEGVRNKEWNI